MIEFLLKFIYRNRLYVKYVISGGTAAVTNLTFLYFFTDILGIWYLLSSILAFVIAFFVSFFLQKFWTFRDKDRDKIHWQMPVYFGVGSFDLFINTIGMFVLVGKFGVMYILAQIIMGASMGISNFLIYRFLIFKKEKPVFSQDEITRGNSKILIATGIYPPDIGGPARMLRSLTQQLKSNGFEVKIITYSDVSKHEDDCDEVIRIIKKGNFSHIKYFLRLLKLAEWADIIYATDTYSVGYFSYLAKVMLDKRYVIRFAGDSAWEIAASRGWTKDYIVDFQDKKYNTRIEKLKSKRQKILANADKVIAVSNFIAGVAQKIGAKKENIKMIYNSVDFIYLKNIDKESHDIKQALRLENYKIIMTSGRLVPWKGVDGLIEAISALKKEKDLPPLKLIVVGDGSDRSRLEKLAQDKEIKNQVIFVGKVSLDKVFAYYNLADVFVLNSQYEALSHVLLEVLRLNKPTIASDRGGNNEVIKHKENGLLVEYNNVENLSQAIKQVFTQEYWQTQKFKEACILSLKKFNWESNVRKTINLIKDIQ